MLVDRARNLWVQEYAASFESQRRWSVFDNRGILLGSVELPNDFRLHDIGVDFVVGAARDEFDVEHVRLYELAKPID